MSSRPPFLRSLFVVATALSVIGLSLVRAQQPGVNQPGTQWSEAQLREAVGLARVGRKLTPKSWPNGSRVAVCLSFDADSEAPLLRDGTTSPTALSAADFGAQSGVPRILAMLDRHQIPATFFITAVDAMLHPDMVAAIQKNGRHEIGVHGWIHETPTRVSAEEEERLLDQAIQYLTKVDRKAPGGVPGSLLGIQHGNPGPDSEEGLSLRQQFASARRAVRNRVARQGDRTSWSFRSIGR